jgi:hypothetical protein
VTYGGLLSVIAAFAPASAAEDFSSRHLQEILTGRAPHQGRSRQFLLRGEPQLWQHFSREAPDIVITYPWGMDLRRDLPRYLKRLYRLLRRRGLVASWREFASKTLWLDILFNDQNSKDIVRDLNAAQRIYEEAWLHAVLLMRDPLSRGWCLFEVGVRVWAVAKEFGLDHPATLRLLTDAHAAGEEYTSRSDWRKYPADAVAARLPVFVAVEGVTDLQAEVLRYVECDSFGGMATSTAADRPEIQQRLVLLMESAEKFNAAVAALARRECAELEGRTRPARAPEATCSPDLLARHPRSERLCHGRCQRARSTMSSPSFSPKEPISERARSRPLSEAALRGCLSPSPPLSLRLPPETASRG